jgi:predicted NBD/HSP70 family sugar kinase
MTQATSLRDIRAHNLDTVLTAISRDGLRTRNSIAEATGLHRSSVTSLVGELTKLGVLREYTPEHNGTTGRPAAIIELVPSVAAGLGLEIRADALVAFVADLAGNARYRAVVHGVHRIKRPESVLGELAGLAHAALFEMERQGLFVSGLTIAVPAEGWSAVPVLEHFRAALGRPELPVTADDTHTLAALAEARGDGLFVVGDGGVGARLLIGGRVVRTAFGRIPLGPDSCLEARTRRAALLDAAGLGDGSLPDLLEHARRREPYALTALADCGRWLGIALASAANLLAPPLIILGGDFATLAPWLAPPIERELRARVFGRSAGWPALAVATAGPDAAARAAAAVAVRRVSPLGR